MVVPACPAPWTRDEVTRLRAVLEPRTDALVALLDRELTIVRATRPGTERLFGRRVEKVEDRDGRELVHPDDLEDFELATKRAFGGDTVRWEGRALTSDGSWNPVQVLLWRAQGWEGLVAIALAGAPVDAAVSAARQWSSRSSSSASELMQ
jgi:PAS domain S-box-containing protein